MSGLLTREAILAADDLKHADVAVPEWGGTVRVRTLTARERDAFLSEAVDDEGKIDRGSFRILLASRAVCDEAGAPIFSAADVAALGGKSAPALERVFDAADKLNTINQQTIDAAEKNSAGGPSDASSSAGLSGSAPPPPSSSSEPPSTS